MTATQDDPISQLQRMVAELKRERDAGLAREAVLAEELAARAAELAARHSEYGERLEHQSATLDVLKVMSASPGDPQPVFDLIVRRAQELSNSRSAGIFEYDGELVHHRSDYGARDLAGAAAYFAAFPMKPTRGSIAGQSWTSRSFTFAIWRRNKNFCRLCGTLR